MLLPSQSTYILLLYSLIHHLNGNHIIHQSTSCNIPHYLPGCDDAICTNQVCEIHPECCHNIWDLNCAKIACHTEHGICKSIGNSCDNELCHISHGSGGCEIIECETKICEIKAECCNHGWDTSCVNLACNIHNGICNGIINSCNTQLPPPPTSTKKQPISNNNNNNNILTVESITKTRDLLQICSNDPCPGNQQRNPISCQCECDQIISCIGNQIFNGVLCECQCETAPTCNAVQQFNAISCECECIETLLCPSRHEQFNSNTCQCDQIQSNCPIDPCPGTQQRNLITCNCECDTIEQCLGNQQFNGVSCECQCETTPTCHAPQQFNPISCECECVISKTCVSGTILNPNNCQCEAIKQLPSSPILLPTSDCPSNPCPGGIQQRDPKTCECECESMTQCPGNQEFNILCECQCATTPICNAPQQFNPILCECGCPQTELCIFPQILNRNLCQCESPPPLPLPICPLIPCPGNQQRNPQTCQCQCANTNICPGNQQFNVFCQCGCVETPICSAPLQFNAISCKCECSMPILTCIVPQIFNPNTCQCIDTTTTTKIPTNNPTTSHPTKYPSLGPTTSNPTTDEPTTSDPTTSNPTTSNPTTSHPTKHPSVLPTSNPTHKPSESPSETPTVSPSENPTISPSKKPSISPSEVPTMPPSEAPTMSPSESPTISPSTTSNPTTNVNVITIEPLIADTTTDPPLTQNPTSNPTTDEPTTDEPTTDEPTTDEPTTDEPTANLNVITIEPLIKGDATTDPPLTQNPTTNNPTKLPSKSPSETPSVFSSENPTISPSKKQTISPSEQPTISPIEAASISSSKLPSISPSNNPSISPSIDPTLSPSDIPTLSPITRSPTANSNHSVVEQPSVDAPDPSFQQLMVLELDGDFDDFIQYLNKTNRTLSEYAIASIKQLIQSDDDPVLSDTIIEIIDVTEGSIIIQYILKMQSMDIFDIIKTNIASTKVIDIDNGKFILPILSNEIITENNSQCVGIGQECNYIISCCDYSENDGILCIAESAEIADESMNGICCIDYSNYGCSKDSDCCYDNSYCEEKIGICRRKIWQRIQDGNNHYDPSESHDDADSDVVHARSDVHNFHDHQDTNNDFTKNNRFDDDFNNEQEPITYTLSLSIKIILCVIIILILGNTVCCIHAQCMQPGKVRKSRKYINEKSQPKTVNININAIKL